MGGRSVSAGLSGWGRVWSRVLICRKLLAFGYVDGDWVGADSIFRAPDSGAGAVVRWMASWTGTACIFLPTAFSIWPTSGPRLTTTSWLLPLMVRFSRPGCGRTLVWLMAAWLLIITEAGPDRLLEPVDIHKNKQCRGHVRLARRAGRPADIIPTATPNDPGRRPFDARHPDPARGWIIHPRSIVVAGPRPGFIALPIPTAVRPNPAAFAIRPPTGLDSPGPEAVPVAANVNPGSIRSQRAVKIGWSVDLNRRRHFQLRPGLTHQQKQASHEHQLADDQFPDCFHTLLPDLPAEHGAPP